MGYYAAMQRKTFLIHAMTYLNTVSSERNQQLLAVCFCIGERVRMFIERKQNSSNEGKCLDAHQFDQSSAVKIPIPLSTAELSGGLVINQSFKQI